MNSDMEWIGVAAFQGKLYLISGTLAEFILDYMAYDPEFCMSGNGSNFRGGVLTVTSDNVQQFLKAMQFRTITMREGELLADSATDNSKFLAFIDFDCKKYVHSYYDLALEDYVPKGWHGVMGDPARELKRWNSSR